MSKAKCTPQQMFQTKSEEPEPMVVRKGVCREEPGSRCLCPTSGRDGSLRQAGTSSPIAGSWPQDRKMTGSPGPCHWPLCHPEQGPALRASRGYCPGQKSQCENGRHPDFLSGGETLGKAGQAWVRLTDHLPHTPVPESCPHPACPAAHGP